MAYAAAISLQKTIERLLRNPDIYVNPPSRKIIKTARKHACYLSRDLLRVESTDKSRSRKRVNVLDGEIREAVCIFEDALESRVADQLLDQQRNGDAAGVLQFSINLLDLNQDLHTFTKRVTKLRTAYKEALNNMPVDDDDDEDVSSATDIFGGEKSKMIGLSDGFRKLKDWKEYGFSHRLSLFRIVGMGGIGKTTLAKEFFLDPDVSSYFPVRAWVKVGRKLRLEDVAWLIIAQVNPECDQNILADEDLQLDLLNQSLRGQRFLFVLDDVWDDQFPDFLGCVDENYNGSRILLTTRVHKIAQYNYTFEMPFLSKEESWDLLRDKVFAQGQLCPRQLEKVGKKIAEKCDGLPLTIVTIAKHLSKEAITPEYWNEVAENRNSVFMNASDQVSKVLYPSYNYLHQYVKMCFMSSGVFPKNCVIRRSKLFNMWIVEEFLEHTEEPEVSDLLGELVDHSLVILYQRSSIQIYANTILIKTCGVHSALWHLCKREARKNKSLHVLISSKDGLSEDVKGQRRLSIHNNMLFGIKDVHKSMEDECASTARSLLCFGPYHPYQVPITFGLRLLRLLDAIAIRFYEFPVQVVNLVLLRYLALTYNGNLPDSISKLWNLQFLIVSTHLRVIRSYGAPTYLPMEIWDLKALKHLQFMGSDLPYPTSDSSLPNLLTLLDASDRTCTRGILERIPNLRKLGLRIELRPGNDDESLGFFAHISCLENLETLKCIIVNPEHKSVIVASPTPLSNFPSGLQKLTLSGLGYPWEEISKIASLPNLQVLKLRNYAFRGPKWEIEEYEFSALKTLEIEDTDLVQWKVGNYCFEYEISSISLKHCYKLEDIYWENSAFPHQFQVVDCNPLAVTSLKKMIKMIEENKMTHFSRVRRFTIDVHSSWVDGELIQQVNKNYPWLL